MGKTKITKKEESRLKEDFHAEPEITQNIPTPPDGGYGWIIVLASFMCNLVIDGVALSFGILLPALIDYYGSSKGSVAWVGSLMTGGSFMVGPIASSFVNKFGCRVTCVIGCIMASSALVLSIYCPTVSSLMLVYGLVGGIGYGFMYLPAIVMVGYYFESKRSLATGISVCGTGVGTFSLAPLTAFLLSSYGWKNAVLVLAVITVVCSIFGVLMKPLPTNAAIVTEAKVLPNTDAKIRRESEKSHSVIFNSNLSISIRKDSLDILPRKDVFYTSSIQNLKEFQSTNSIAEYRYSVHSIQKPAYTEKSEICGGLIDLSLLKEPVFLAIAISNLFGFTAFYIPFVYVVELAKTVGIEANQAAFLISIIGITNTIGRIAIGFIADFPKVNNLHVNNLCILLGAVSTALFPFCNDYITFVLVCICFGISASGYVSLTSIILVELLGLEKLTNAFGMNSLFRGVASLIGSPIAGTLYDITDSYTIPFFVGAALFTISAGISATAPFFKKNSEFKKRDDSN